MCSYMKTSETLLKKKQNTQNIQRLYTKLILVILSRENW